jgi:hypothetical protein
VHAGSLPVKIGHVLSLEPQACLRVPGDTLFFSRRFAFDGDVDVDEARLSIGDTSFLVP